VREKRSIRRLNWKALVITGVGLVLLIGGGFLAAGAVRDKVQAEVLQQAEELEENGKRSLALRHLRKYLDEHPDDLKVLDRYARLLSETAQRAGSYPMILSAIEVNERLIRLDPNAPERQQNRRWLAEFYIAVSEADRQSARNFGLQMANESAAMRSKFAAAEILVRDLIERGADDAEAYRLLGMALEGRAGEPGKLQEAIDAYNRALALDPGDISAAVRLARIYRDQRNEPDLVDRITRELVQAEPESADAWIAYYSIYSGIPGAEEKAEQGLANALEFADPDNIAIRLTAATKALREGDTEKARAIVAAIPEERQDDTRVNLLIALIDMAEKNPDQAINRWRETLLASQGTDANLLWTLANALIDVGRLEEALPLIRRFKDVAGEGASGSYSFLMGLYQEKQGQLDQAIASFDQALEQDLPEDYLPSLLVARAQAHLRLGNRAEAFRDLERAIEEDPESIQARIALATARFQTEGIDGAVEEIREGLDALPDEPGLRTALARFYLTQEANQPAESRSFRDFERAIEEAEAIDGPTPSTVVLRANRLLIENRADEAFQRLEQAVAQWPRNTELWQTWADGLTRAGRVEEALAVVNRAIEQSGADGDAGSFRVAKARLLTALGRGGEAIRALKAGASELPPQERARAFQALGQMLASRGQFDEAREAFQAWAVAQPGSPLPTVSLLDLAIKTGNQSAAEAALDELRGDPKASPSLPWMLGKAQVLLSFPSAKAEETEARQRQAIELLDAVLERSPELASARFLRGQARVALGELEEALADYRRAWASGYENATRRMIDLIVRLGQADSVDSLPRPEDAPFSQNVDRLAAEAFLRYGDLQRAEDYLKRAVESAGDDREVRAWRLAMFDRLGSNQNVQALLREEINRNPEDASNWLALVRYQLSQGSRDQAEETATRMLQEVPAENPALLEAQVREALGDAEGARAAFKRALEERPDDPGTVLTVARHFWSSGDADQAAALLERRLEEVPDDRPTARLLALVKASQVADEATWNEAWAALGPEPSDAQAEAPQDRLARAVVLASHPNPERRKEAIGRLETLIEDQPAGETLTAAAREALAKLLMRQDQPRRAAEVAAVTAIQSADPPAIALYTEALIEAGQLDEAHRQLQRLKGVSPNADAIAGLELKLTEAGAEAGESADALEAAYQQAVAERDNPTSIATATFRRLVQLGEPGAEVAERVGLDLAERFPNLAWLPAQWFVNQERFDTALDLAEQAIGSGDANALFEGARAALMAVEATNGNFEGLERAVQLVETAHRQAPDQERLDSILAMARHFQGDYAEEIRLYRELLAQEPDNPVYLNNLAWALGVQEDGSAESIELINRALEAVPGEPVELLDTRGVLLHRLGRYEEAIRDLQKAAQSERARPVYWFHLAQAQRDAAQAEQAEASFRKAIDLGLTSSDVEPFERTAFETFSKR